MFGKLEGSKRDGNNNKGQRRHDTQSSQTLGSCELVFLCLLLYKKSDMSYLVLRRVSSVAHALLIPKADENIPKPHLCLAAEEALRSFVRSSSRTLSIPQLQT